MHASIQRPILLQFDKSLAFFGCGLELESEQRTGLFLDGEEGGDGDGGMAVWGEIIKFIFPSIRLVENGHYRRPYRLRRCRGGRNHPGPCRQWWCIGWCYSCRYWKGCTKGFVRRHSCYRLQGFLAQARIVARYPGLWFRASVWRYGWICDVEVLGKADTC